MSTNSNTIRPYNTKIRTEKDGTIIVRFYQTDIVSFNPANKRQITLNTNGYNTSTTKGRMNEASRQFDLGYYVRQEKGTMIVRRNDNDQFVTELYDEPVTFNL